jgi:hypothetical protein
MILLQALILAGIVTFLQLLFPVFTQIVLDRVIVESNADLLHVVSYLRRTPRPAAEWSSVPSRKSDIRTNHMHERKINETVQEGQTRCPNQGPQANQGCSRPKATDSFPKYRDDSASGGRTSASLKSIGNYKYERENNETV